MSAIGDRIAAAAGAIELNATQFATVLMANFTDDISNPVAVSLMNKLITDNGGAELTTDEMTNLVSLKNNYILMDDTGKLFQIHKLFAYSQMLQDFHGEAPVTVAAWDSLIGLS